MAMLLSHIVNLQSNLNQEIDDVRMKVIDNSLAIEKCKTRAISNTKEIMLLQKNFTTGLSRLLINEEEKIPYVFSAPPRNRYLAGRIKEIQEDLLEEINREKPLFKSCSSPRIIFEDTIYTMIDGGKLRASTILNRI